MKCPQCGHPDSSHNDAGCFHDDGAPCFCRMSGEQIRFPEQYQRHVVVPVTMKILNGAELIAEERQRQITDEGWSAENDDAWVGRELALAALCYLACYINKYFRNPYIAQIIDTLWPWRKQYWKPSHDIAILKKAGALIAAEIDRLQRRVRSTEGS
jgi:hypothetical protein